MAVESTTGFPQDAVSVVVVLPRSLIRSGVEHVLAADARVRVVDRVDQADVVVCGPGFPTGPRTVVVGSTAEAPAAAVDWQAVPERLVVAVLRAAGERSDNGNRAQARPRLGQREVEALRWVAQGLTHRQVGRRMGLTEETVNTYLKRVRDKLDAHNRTVLLRRALELGYLAG